MGVVINDSVMGNDSYDEKNEFVVIPEGIETEANVILYEEPNSKGIVLKTGNGFFRRLLLMISNPFRYLFTGKIYY